MSSLRSQLYKATNSAPINNGHLSPELTYSGSVQSTQNVNITQGMLLLNFLPSLELNWVKMSVSTTLSSLVTQSALRGTPCRERLSEDGEAIASTIQKQVPSFSSINIKDCHRLGKYLCFQDCPHPILAILNGASDVSTILSYHFTSGGAYIAPDLPPEVR